MTTAVDTATDIPRPATGTPNFLARLDVARIFTHVALLALVILWTFPTAGLLISSLRDKDQLAISGWWTSLQSVSVNARARTLNSEAQTEREGSYLISGTLFEENDNRSIQSYGGGFLQGELTDYAAGDVVALENGE